MQDHYRRKGGLESFSGDWERALDFYERPFRPEEATAYLETKAEIVQRIYFAALLSDVPEDLRKVLRRLSLWLYALDETADLVRDRDQGRVTYMTVAADPVAELRRFHAELEETVRSTARRDPKLLFSLMKAMTEGVVAAVLSGKDIEGDLFGAPEGPVNRSADPSSPRKAGGA
jgi:hypothetical protein